MDFCTLWGHTACYSDTRHLNMIRPQSLLINLITMTLHYMTSHMRTMAEIADMVVRSG